MNINQNGITEMYMIHEVMSRARMLEPQTIPSEASRSARQIAIRARKHAARERNGQ
jgi:hypothetical protein